MYVREVAGRKLTFQVSGKLWMRSLVMRDVETGSDWSHLLGRAMDGELQGQRLKPLLSEMVTWAVWRENHPQTSVLNLSRTSREYTSEFYEDPARFVLGFRRGEQAYAISMDKLQQTGILQFQISGDAYVATFDPAAAACYLYLARLDDIQLTFTRVDDRHMRDSLSDSRWRLDTGQAVAGESRGKQLQPVIGIMSYRRAWDNFHPDSQDIE